MLTFVGFLAGFRDPGGVPPLAGGLIGAGLTTWVTFVPCFLWVLLGAPYIERLRNNRALSGALSAITAAVVGVILNLTVWFALHVLFRNVGELNLGALRPAWPDFHWRQSQEATWKHRINLRRRLFAASTSRNHWVSTLPS